MKPNQHPLNKKTILSFVLLLAVTVIFVFGILIYSIIKVNEEAHIAIEGHVAAIIEDKLNQYETLTKDYAFWDATIKNAYLSTNPKWIDENIGEYLTDTFKITDVFIIDSHDDAVLSLKDGQVDTSNYLTINREDLTSLIVKARQSGPIPVPVSGILMINGDPALVGVSVLTPEDGTSLPSPRPLLVLAIRLDQNYLQLISKQYRLIDLQFTSGEKNSITESSIKIINPSNKILGRLSWQPGNPGNLVLSKIQIPLLLLLAVIIFIAYYIIYTSRSTALRLEKAYDELAYNANHDALTGLLNRRLFEELFVQTIHTVKRHTISCALLCIDLDDFKYVNDTFGHKTGDQLLIEVAERIKNSIRESDISARMGGDEFAVILQNQSNFVDIEATVQKIIMNVSQPVLISGNEVRVGASIGIAMIPGDGIDSDLLMTKADLALYRCKEQGRNTFRFYSDLNVKKKPVEN